VASIHDHLILTGLRTPLEQCVLTTWQETFLLQAAGNAMCGFVLADVFMGILTHTHWATVVGAYQRIHNVDHVEPDPESGLDI
jgi:hypothetical protein